MDEPEPGEGVSERIEARRRSIGAFEVGRVLPAPTRRHVGPFVFLDHMGPAEIAAGHGLDVRPHPHIALSTVTWLIDGAILHRDSLGTEQIITPGAVNWMTAGRGIVHSERSPAAHRATGAHVHGLQLWVALPAEHEETDPAFSHHPADTLPRLEAPGVVGTLLAGAAYGLVAPVAVHSPLVYVEATLEPGAVLEVPAGHRERAVYVLDGEVEVGADRVPRGILGVLGPTVTRLRAVAPTRLVVLGGEPLGERFLWWNFVSSSAERVAQAAADWQAGRFPTVPGDDHEFIPLPDQPPLPAVRRPGP